MDNRTTKSKTVRPRNVARGNLYKAGDTKEIKIGDTIQMSRRALYTAGNEDVICKKVTELWFHPDGSVEWFRTTNRKRFMFFYLSNGDISRIAALGSKSQYQPEGIIKN